jgi:hypothetical protein
MKNLLRAFWKSAISRGLVAVKGYTEVRHQTQDLLFALLQPQQEIACWPPD